MDQTGNQDKMQGAQAGLLESAQEAAAPVALADASISIRQELPRPVLIYDDQ